MPRGWEPVDQRGPRPWKVFVPRSLRLRPTQPHDLAKAKARVQSHVKSWEAEHCQARGSKGYQYPYRRHWKPGSAWQA